MKQVVYTVKELANEMADTHDAAFFGYYDDVKNLAEELIRQGYSMYNIELEVESRDNYNSEFVLYLDYDGVTIEKMYYKERYVYGAGSVNFFASNCSKELIDENADEDSYNLFVVFKEDINKCEDCEWRDECDEFKKPVMEEKSAETDNNVNIEYEDEDGGMKGFTISKKTQNSDSYVSFFSTSDFTDDTVKYFLNLI